MNSLQQAENMDLIREAGLIDQARETIAKKNEESFFSTLNLFQKRRDPSIERQIAAAQNEAKLAEAHMLEVKAAFTAALDRVCVANQRVHGLTLPGRMLEDRLLNDLEKFSPHELFYAIDKLHSLLTIVNTKAITERAITNIHTGFVIERGDVSNFDDIKKVMTTISESMAAIKKMQVTAGTHAEKLAQLKKLCDNCLEQAKTAGVDMRDTARIGFSKLFDGSLAN